MKNSKRLPIHKNYTSLSSIKKSLLICLILFSYFSAAIQFNIGGDLNHQSEISTLMNLKETEDTPISSSISFGSDSEIDNFFQGNGTDGLSWENAHNLNNTELNGDESESINFQNTRRYVIIENCTFILSGFLPIPISLTNTSNIRITNCTFDLAKIGGGIQASNCSFIEMSYLNFLEKTFENDDPDAIVIENNCHDIWIENSTIFGFYEKGIDIQQSFDIMIFDINFKKMKASSIQLSNSYRVQIEKTNISSPVIENNRGFTFQNVFQINITNNDLGNWSVEIDANSYQLNFSTDALANLVNGYELIYYENETDITKSFDNEKVGQLILNNVNSSLFEKLKIHETYDGVQVFNSNDCEIKDLGVNNSNHLGMVVQYCENLKISNYTSWNNNFGASIKNSNNITIQDSKIKNNDTNASNDGLYFRSVERINILSNYFENCTLAIECVKSYPTLLELKDNILIYSELDLGLPNEIIADNSNTRNGKKILFFINCYNETYTLGEISNAYFFNSSHMILKDGFLEGAGDFVLIKNCSWLEFRDFQFLNSSDYAIKMVESNHIHILNSTFQNGTGDYIIIDESSDVLINRCAFLNISTEWKSAIYVKYSENIEIIENWFFDMFMGYRDTGEGEEEYTTGNVSLNYYGFIQDCFFDNETLDHLEDIDNINTTIFDRNAFGSIVYTNEMLVFTGTQTDEGGDTGTSENTDDGDSDPTDNTGDTGNQDDDPSGLSPGIIALIVIVSIVVVSTGVFFLLKKKHILSEKSSKE